MIRAYRPARPSLWRDLRAIPFDWHGLPMLAAFAVVLVWASLAEVLGPAAFEARAVLERIIG